LTCSIQDIYRHCKERQQRSNLAVKGTPADRDCFAALAMTLA
jgi:hypothetical protein